MRVVDFRSDFLSRPTAAMKAAMLAAADAPPTFGLNDDPAVVALQDEGARLLGKEAALFCPTATMCNQIAIHLHCRPGQSLLAESYSHIFLGESGSLAALSGVLAVPIPGDRGRMDLARLRAAIQGAEVQRSASALIVIENTHANGGGLVLPLDYCREVHALAKEKQLRVHLDGARLFNAAAYLGIPVEQLAAHCDSLCISLNKGLGAPMGALLAGPKSFIREAIEVRQLFGGGWRPAGILAAAALVGLRTMVTRIGEDHENARRLADGLAKVPGLAVDMERVDTNIVFASLDRKATPEEFVRRIAAEGILALPASARLPSVVRFVTHADIDAAAIAYALGKINSVMS